jgi:hypothetical protein
VCVRAQVRAEFTLPIDATLTRARAIVASPGYYTLTVDGRSASNNVLGPFTVFTRRVLYDVVDVTALLEPPPPPQQQQQQQQHQRQQENQPLLAHTVAVKTTDAHAHTIESPSSPTRRHALALTLGNGWYSQPTIALGPRMVCLRLSVAYALPNGSHGTAVVVTDTASWQAADGPTVVADIYEGAVHDAALETTGWEFPGYNTSLAPRGRWGPVTSLPSPLQPGVGVLRAQVMPPIRRVEVFEPVSVKYFPASSVDQRVVWVVDFGQNMAGTVRLTVPALVISTAAPGSNITLRHAEAVYPNGSLHHLYGARVAESVTYVVSPSSANGDDVLYEPAHTYFGFRYVEISGEALHHFTHGVTRGERHSGSSSSDSDSSTNSSKTSSGGVDSLDDEVPLPVKVVAHFVHSDLERTGSITTSSDLLNRIVHAATYSQLGTWTSIPTGCTQRERRGWLGDAQLASEGQLHTVFAAPAYVKFLDDIADTQADEWAEHNGSVPEVCPNYGHGPVPPDPPFGVGFAVIWWNHYRYNGDDVALSAHYNGVKAFADTLVTRAGGSDTFAGVLGNHPNTSTHGDWVSVANQSKDATTCSGRAALDHHANATCCLFMECPDPVVSGFYYVIQLRIVAAAAAELGLSQDAERYAALARSAVSLLAAASYRGGRMGYGFQTDQALALALGAPGGVVPPDDVPAVASSLARDVASRGNHLSTGIFGTKVLLPALSSNGYADAAIAVLTQPTEPSWGAWVTKYNATTLFEMWGAFDGDPPSTGTASRNHVMFSTFIPWLYQVLTGIAMDGSDYGTSVLFPPPPPVAVASQPPLGSTLLPEALLAPAVMRSGGKHVDGVELPAASLLRVATAFETFRIAPLLVSDLTTAAASVVTMRGRVAVSLRWSSSSVSLNVSIPVGCDTPVTVPMPPGGRCDPSTVVVIDKASNGSAVWRRGSPVDGVDGVVSASAAVPTARGDVGVVVTVGSGNYQFVATCS